jgi:putative ABC transport system substrate-binding protein
LHGGKPNELPRSGPFKFELVINLNTAKAFGLAVIESVQRLADEVIE